jgi:uncharacterized membrane protein (UPF0127 family)
LKFVPDENPMAGCLCGAFFDAHCLSGQTGANSGPQRIGSIAASDHNGWSKVHSFTVEVAATEAQQARGLMFRSSLAPDAGMIFPMRPPRMASFWMKNTFISLDIIFVRANGSIARIAANTQPFSLDPIESGEPVAAVLEIAGGRAAALGIREGDRVVLNP